MEINTGLDSVPQSDCTTIEMVSWSGYGSELLSYSLVQKLNYDCYSNAWSKVRDSDNRGQNDGDCLGNDIVV